MRDPTLEECSPLRAVSMERVKQDARWGEQNHSDAHWLAILTEEVGEVAECVCKVHVGGGVAEKSKAVQYDGLMDYEIIQVAAVAVAWLESRRRSRGKEHDNG